MFGILGLLAKETFKEKLILAIAASLGAEAAKAVVQGVSRVVSDHYQKHQKDESPEKEESEDSEGDS